MFKRRSYKLYVVIEYTPGYLPENDDPPVFDQWNEAVNYVLAERQRLFEDDFGWQFDPDKAAVDSFMLDVGEFDGDGFIYYDRRKIHDLGRIVQIIPYEEDLC